MEASRHPYQSPDPRVSGLLGVPPPVLPDVQGMRRLELMVSTVFDRLTSVEGPPSGTGTGRAA
jgi:hypothetical protein